jgi:hypothetical protein
MKHKPAFAKYRLQKCVFARELSGVSLALNLGAQHG